MINNANDKNNLAKDSKSAGLSNEKLVLSLLRKHGPLSQAQLCKLSKFSSSTSSYIVGRLREKNLIVESQGQSAKRGAKPTNISINPRGAHVVGVEINPSHINTGIFDFNGEKIDSVSTPLPADVDYQPPTIVRQIVDILKPLLRKHDIDEMKLLGVAVTLSGSITKNGVVKLSSPLGWKNVPLQQMIQEHFQAPVFIHPTRVRLLAETSLSNKDEFRNVLYLNVADGVGASVISDGELIRGATDRSCEIGHIVIDCNGPLCGCGNHGCLEAYISGPALTKRIIEDVAADKETSLTSTVSKGDNPEIVIGKWGQALIDNDRYAQQLRDMVADKLSRAAAIIINCYDPDIILLAGYVSQQCADFLIDKIHDRIKLEVYDGSSRPITIIPARSGNEALIRGGAIAVLQSAMTVI